MQLSIDFPEEQEQMRMNKTTLKMILRVMIDQTWIMRIILFSHKKIPLTKRTTMSRMRFLKIENGNLS